MAHETPPTPPGRSSSPDARARRWDTSPLLRFARRQVRGRDLLRWLLVALVVAVPCAAFGISTAAVDGTLGPHTARYEVTLDSEVTVDLGPLGTLVIDSPAPMLGARVVIREIPRDVTSVDASATLEAVAGDLEEYVQFFNAPQTAVEAAVRALVIDAARRTAAAILLVTVALVLLRAALGPRRRAELVDGFRPHRAAVTGATAALVLVVGTVTSSAPVDAAADRERTASSVFDGTPLEGARITGRLAGVIDTYGGYVVDAYRENQAFYATATANVEAAWLERLDHDQQLAAARAALQPRAVERPSGRATSPTPTAGTADPTTGAATATATPTEPTDAPTAATDAPMESPSGTPDEPTEDQPDDEEEPAPEPVVMLVVSDMHCNVGMTGPIRVVAELSGATVVLNAGDTTVNGSVVESYCVQQLVDAAGDAQTVAVTGNHDGPDTVQQMRDAGVQLLEGEVIDVQGIRILGAADPRATRIGVGTTLNGNATLDDLAAQLADVACTDADGVDLLLVHDPAMGRPTLERGCATSQVSGHMHRREGPVWREGGTLYVSSSTAGATLGQPTIGPLSGIAEITVLRFDPESGDILDYRLVQVRPDGTASVWAALAWPGEPRPPTPNLRYT